MPTTRQTPLGYMLEHGFKALITFEADPDISFWEKTVKPPGLDGGDAIDITTMHNTLWRTSAPRKLITATEITGTCAYAPEVLIQCKALINVETMITILFSDGDTWEMPGYLRIFDPQEISEGSQPEANYTITPTNRDPDTKEELGPEWAGSTGTG